MRIVSLGLQMIVWCSRCPGLKTRKETRRNFTKTGEGGDMKGSDAACTHVMAASSGNPDGAVDL